MARAPDVAANIQRLASDFMRDYVFLTVGRVGSASKDVTQTIEYVEEQDKLETLMEPTNPTRKTMIPVFGSVRPKKAWLNV